VEEALKKFPGVKITRSIDIKRDPRIACDTISTFMQVGAGGGALIRTVLLDPRIANFP